MASVLGAAISVAAPIRADDSTKLTNLTFSQAVRLPGVTLEPGTYRFELADPGGSRNVIKVSNQDGTKQLAMLNTIPYNLTEAASKPVVVFGEAKANQPEPMKAWVYPASRTGYEFIYPHDEAITLAREYRTEVLSSDGDKIERVNEKGESTPQKTR
jgi:hypothetical protein